MTLERYDIIDPYTLEELKREYRNADATGRITLLKNLYHKGKIAPYEIALLAVEDSDVQIRQWIARHGEYLDYRDWHPESGRLDQPERNLVDRLKNDPDAFVRACLRENPTAFQWSLFGDIWHDYFREASHLERLALVRNPEVDGDLIEDIFDHQDTKLGIDLKQRKELVLAVLTNDRVERKSHRQAYKGLGTEHPIRYLHQALHEQKEHDEDASHFSKLWHLVSKWPESGGIQHAVYRTLGAKDETKAEIYQTCALRLLREAILDNCSGNDTKTIMLGRKDSDERCRDKALQAIKKGGEITHHSLETLFESKDKDILSELAFNESLTVLELLEIRHRLYKLGDKDGAGIAEGTIERKQKAPLESWQRRRLWGTILGAKFYEYNVLLLSITLIGSVYWFGSFEHAVLIALVIVVARAFMK